MGRLGYLAHCLLVAVLLAFAAFKLEAVGRVHGDRRMALASLAALELVAVVLLVQRRTRSVGALLTGAAFLGAGIARLATAHPRPCACLGYRQVPEVVILALSASVVVLCGLLLRFPRLSRNARAGVK